MKKSLLLWLSGLALSATVVLGSSDLLEAARYSYVPLAANSQKANSQKTDELRTLPNTAFQVGEKLTFDISYGFVTAGEAVMSVPGYKYLNGRKTYETKIEARSLPSFDW